MWNSYMLYVNDFQNGVLALKKFVEIHYIQIMLREINTPLPDLFHYVIYGLPFPQC